MADPNVNVIVGADTSQLQKGLQAAGQSLQRFDAAAKRSTASIGQANISLTNLARVAQDAPFGFIAIANNLDPLVQSLGSLSKSSGGALGALKALGGALIGPAGLALGFSAVSSAITFAIQKYGSLGNAINALISSNSSLSSSIADAESSYGKFNQTARTAAQIANEESIASSAQVTRIKTLIEVVNNSNETYARRTAAIEQLKGINKDYFGNLDLEKLKVGDLEVAYTRYINKIIAAAKAKGFEEELSKTNLELDKQQKLLGQLVKERGLARERLQALAQQPAAEGIGGAPILQALFDPNLEKQVQNQIDVVGALFNRVQELENGIRETTLSTLDFGKAQGQSAGSAKTATKAQKELSNELERQRKELLLLQKNFKDLTRATETDIDINRQFQQENPPEPPPQQFPFDPIALITAQINAENAKKKQDEYNESVKTLVSTFNDFLSPAINTIFGALENGQNVFKALGQSLKALIVQLVATVAKAAILAVILSAISGGGFAIGAAGSVAGGTGNFGGIFKNLIGSSFGLPKKTAAPTFSGAAGINGGGIQLAGQVVFVQRGPDLVGVLNQGNARIGRVG